MRLTKVDEATIHNPAANGLPRSAREPAAEFGTAEFGTVEFGTVEFGTVEFDPAESDAGELDGEATGSAGSGLNRRHPP
jgi:hypothetical protein